MVLAVSVTYSMSLPRRQLDVWGLELRGELWERNTDRGSSTHRWSLEPQAQRPSLKRKNGVGGVENTRQVWGHESQGRHVWRSQWSQSHAPADRQGH